LRLETPENPLIQLLNEVFYEKQSNQSIGRNGRSCRIKHRFGRWCMLCGRCRVLRRRLGLLLKASLL
jgi:hypothetical protein